MTATFLWEGDDFEPAVLVRLEGAGTENTEAGARDALESEVPGFQDLVAFELAVRRGDGWQGLWLLWRPQEVLPVDLLAAGLAPGGHGRVVVAPASAEGPWTVALRDQGLVKSLQRTAGLPVLAPTDGPFVVVSEDGAVPDAWKRTGLAAKVVSKAKVVPVASVRRLVAGAEGRDFPVLRLAPKASKGLGPAILLALTFAANLLLAAGVLDPAAGPEAEAVPPALPSPPRPSAVLAAVSDVPGWDLLAFEMTGPSWHLELRAGDGLQVVEGLKKRVPGLRLTQFQPQETGTRVVVEGEGYP